MAAVIFAAASLRKDSVNRIGDLHDDGKLSAITQSAPPENHLLGFKVHHLRM